MIGKYRDDYEKVTRLDGSGKLVKDYRYIGDYYVLPFDEHRKAKTAALNLLFSFLFVGLHVAAGIVNASSSHTFWIVFPYFFLFLPEAYMFVGVISYALAPVRMERADYMGSIVRMKHSCMAVLVLAGINMLLDLFYMIRYHAGIMLGRELFYFGCFAVLAALCVLYGFCYDRMFAGVAMEQNN